MYLHIQTTVTVWRSQRNRYTQPLLYSDVVNDPDAVFDFYDDFAGTSLDMTKWTVTNGSPAV
jgi:hypothetical protein